MTQNVNSGKCSYVNNEFNPLMAKVGGGGVGVDAIPNKFFQFFSEMRRIFCKLNFQL